MKWLLVLFSIFKPFFSGGTHEMPNPVAELKDMIKKNALKVMFAFAIVSALATIFAAGFVIIGLELSNQFEMYGSLRYSPVAFTGTLFILLPVLIAAIAVKRYDHDKDDEKKVVQQAPQIGTVHPLQDALALLIHDFVKEREMRRAQEELHPHPHHHPEPPRPHAPPAPHARPSTPDADDYRH